MKILITENKLNLVLKQSGTEKTIKLLGGWENFCAVYNINSPMGFLHLFDDLDVVQSEERKDWVLFRYKKGHNFMVYNRKKEEVYFNYNEIWSFLRSNFALNYEKTQELTKVWLGEVYNLRGITTDNIHGLSHLCWMRSII